jgi:capsular exopolysaccharide synthesis family protein
MNLQAQASHSEAPAFFDLTPASGDDGDLMSYVRIIRKRLWAIVLLTILAGAVGWTVANGMPTIYSSTATLLIEPSPSSQRRSNQLEEGGMVSPFGDNVQTQMEIMRSRSVSLRTVMQLRLWEQPEFDPRRAAGVWQEQLKEKLGFTPKPTPVWTDQQLADAVVAPFLNGIDITPVLGSRLIRVSFTARDPELAALIVNTWIKVYIAEDRAARFEAAQNTTAWVASRAAELRQNVQAAERDLQAFREKNNLVSVQGNTQAVSTRQMEELTPAVVQARVKLTQLETAYNEMVSVKNGDYSAVSWVMSFGTVPDAKARETSARFKVAELSQNYGYEHPRMVQAQAELAESRENLRRQVTVAVASLTREYQTAKATLRSLDTTLSQERSRAQTVNRSEFALGALEREVEATRQLYNMFVARDKELELTADLEKMVARVVDLAQPMYAPVGPKRGKIILAAVLLGLFGSLAIALAIEFLDNTVKGSEDAERKLGMPVLASLPLMKGTTRTSVSLAVLDTAEPLYDEAIRTARTGLLLSAIDEQNHVFMVTSPSPDEGKTTFAMNLAIAMAQNYRTLLIEGDMRRPLLAKVLGLEDGAKGIANFVAVAQPLEHCLHKLRDTELMVMPVGDVPPNPLELLSSKRFARTIAELREQFEYIIIDTPPIEVVSDALAISRVVNGAVVILKAEETTYPLAKSTLQQLARAHVNVLGLVINGLDFAKAQRYYGQYQGYGQVGAQGYLYRTAAKA